MSDRRQRSAIAALSFAALVMLAGPGNASPPQAGDRLNFVACPLVRDTYVPAWLAQYEGELYYLGAQGDLGTEFYPPQLGHRALIEGVVSEDSRISGGVVLSPVKVSVLPELDASCNTILPAAGFPDPPHHRSPGPTNSEEEEEPRPAPIQRSLTEPSTFEVPFAFDVGDHLFARDSRQITQAANFQRDAKAREVRVVGYRGAAILSNGDRMAETDQVAFRRAEMVAKMLAHAGVPRDLIEVETRDASAEADGVDDHLLRRVAIVVTP